jgi:hypothetical protein
MARRESTPQPALPVRSPASRPVMSLSAVGASACSSPHERRARLHPSYSFRASPACRRCCKEDSGFEGQGHVAYRTPRRPTPQKQGPRLCEETVQSLTAGGETTNASRAAVLVPFGWHGWHGFRRGLASNLNRLGVDDSVIQRILRHSTVATTQNHYIKTASLGAIAAMKQFSEALLCSTCAPDEPSNTVPVVQ